MADSGVDKKRVVVIGGGVAGSLVAKTLQGEADVFLVDTKEYFEIPWVALRSMCDPSFAKRAVFSHSEYLPHANIISSAAVDITDTEVVTAKGNRVPYDYAVIATGHADIGSYYTTDDKFGQYETEHEKIKSSKSILIIGGGQTGVELAGEIAVDYPDKKLTIVHRGSMLLEFIGERASRKVVAWLKSRKVEVILGQTVDVNTAKDGVYKTSGGESIDAECHFICIGKPIGSGWIKETGLKDSLDIHGRLMVDSHLRVKGYTNVFGIGDITDIPELKLGYLAQRHAMVTARNIKALMKGGNESSLYEYKPALPLSLIALGRREAVAQFYCLSIIGRLPGMIKSEDLFVGKTRRQLGLQPDLS